MKKIVLILLSLLLLGCEPIIDSEPNNYSMLNGRPTVITMSGGEPVIEEEIIEEPVEVFNSVLFNISTCYGQIGYVVVNTDSYTINSSTITFNDAVGVIVDGVKIINTAVATEDPDKFFFRSDNLNYFFGFDFVEMSKNEVEIAMDVLKRYPKEDLLDLTYEYNPTNPILEEMGYFN